MTNMEISDAVRGAAIAEYSVDAFAVAPEVLLMLLPQETYEKLELLASKAVLARTKYDVASTALEKFRKDYPGVVVDSKGKGVRARRLREASLKAARKMRATYLNVSIFIEEVMPLFKSSVTAYANQMESGGDDVFCAFWESQFKTTREAASSLLGEPVTSRLEAALSKNISTLVKIHEFSKAEDESEAFSFAEDTERLDGLQQEAVEVAYEMHSLMQAVRKALNLETEDTGNG